MTTLTLVLAITLAFALALPVVIVVVCATVRPAASPAIARSLRGLAEVVAAARSGTRRSRQPWWSWRAASVREPDSDG